jgi:hypothetical protein
MKFKYFWLALTILCSFNVRAQINVKAKLLDSIKKTPVIYASIRFNSKSGVISNDNGEFSIAINENTTPEDSLVISCLGYKEKKISVTNFRDSIIYLSSQSIDLSEVLITNKKYTVEEIIEKAKEGLITNYDGSHSKRKLFFRESYYTEIDKGDVNLKKSTIPEINQKLIDSLLLIVPKNTGSHTEILGELYGEMGPAKPQKMAVIKSSSLYDKGTDINFDNYEKRFNDIFKKHVKCDSYFKIKSGWFSTTEDIDSTLFGDEQENKEKKTLNDTLIAQQKKKDSIRNIGSWSWRKSNIHRFHNNTFLDEDNALNFIHKARRYKFELQDFSYVNGAPVYIISFEPKRSEDFSGTLYINSEDFAIVRVDYKNIKQLSSFSLLGISLKKYLKEGTIIFEKNENEKYSIKYIDETLGQQVGIKRPIKIVEKNKNVKGRRKQNEVNGSIHFIVKNIEKTELIIFETTALSETDFETIKEKPYIKPIQLEQYDPNFWKGYTIIEPNQAIKNFKTIKKD